MLGVLTNTVAVLVGSSIGLLCKKGFSKKIIDATMLGIGLCTLYIGISGSLNGNKTSVVIVSLVLGTIAGTWIDIDGRLSSLANWAEQKYGTPRKDDLKYGEDTGSVKSSTIAEGFVTACLLFCIGAMTVMGSLEAGLLGDNEMLFTKSVLDFISSIMLSVSFGIGVLFSAVFVLIFQGALVLLAGFLQPILTSQAIGDLTCVGSLLIIGLGLNLVGATKIKVANYLPALLFSPAITYLFQFFNIG